MLFALCSTRNEVYIWTLVSSFVTLACCKDVWIPFRLPSFPYIQIPYSTEFHPFPEKITNLNLRTHNSFSSLEISNKYILRLKKGLTTFPFIITTIIFKNIILNSGQLIFTCQENKTFVSKQVSHSHSELQSQAFTKVCFSWAKTAFQLNWTFLLNLSRCSSDCSQ